MASAELNFYQVMNLDKGLSAAELRDNAKVAWHKASLRWHPDKAKNMYPDLSPEELKIEEEEMSGVFSGILSQAKAFFETLTEEKKKNYDDDLDSFDLLPGFAAPDEAWEPCDNFKTKSIMTLWHQLLFMTDDETRERLLKLHSYPHVLRELDALLNAPSEDALRDKLKNKRLSKKEESQRPASAGVLLLKAEESDKGRKPKEWWKGCLDSFKIEISHHAHYQECTILMIQQLMKDLRNAKEGKLEEYVVCFETERVVGLNGWPLPAHYKYHKAKHIGPQQVDSIDQAVKYRDVFLSKYQEGSSKHALESEHKRQEQEVKLQLNIQTQLTHVKKVKAILAAIRDERPVAPPRQDLQNKMLQLGEVMNKDGTKHPLMVPVADLVFGVLLAAESGHGKTFAAKVIAQEALLQIPSLEHAFFFDAKKPDWVQFPLPSSRRLSAKELQRQDRLRDRCIYVPYTFDSNFGINSTLMQLPMTFEEGLIKLALLSGSGNDADGSQYKAIKESEKKLRNLMEEFVTKMLLHVGILTAKPDPNNLASVLHELAVEPPGSEKFTLAQNRHYSKKLIIALTGVCETLLREPPHQLRDTYLELGKYVISVAEQLKEGVSFEHISLGPVKPGELLFFGRLLVDNLKGKLNPNNRILEPTSKNCLCVHDPAIFERIPGKVKVHIFKTDEVSQEQSNMVIEDLIDKLYHHADQFGGSQESPRLLIVVDEANFVLGKGSRAAAKLQAFFQATARVSGTIIMIDAQAPNNLHKGMMEALKGPRFFGYPGENGIKNVAMNGISPAKVKNLCLDMKHKEHEFLYLPKLEGSDGARHLTVRFEHLHQYHSGESGWGQNGRKGQEVLEPFLKKLAIRDEHDLESPPSPRSVYQHEDTPGGSSSYKHREPDMSSETPIAVGNRRRRSKGAEGEDPVSPPKKSRSSSYRD